ncbi:uncharacterized protein LOC117334451 [Pecten maximus]|uniref:uncharacterized protein LOC117334451 n=1 Tax=Pecten maximus TaxID=6579 RepID=UPI0014587691|nr:uncharacterized protein LOC117334451 [Pecten maximus]
MTLIPSAEMTTPEVEAEAQSEPTVSEIMWPPTALLVLGAFMFLMLYLLWQRRRVKFKRPAQRKFHPSTFVYEYEDFVNCDPVNLPVFIADRDEYAIDKLRYFQNNGLSLLYMVMPPALTLLFCPMTLFMYSPITNYFWPKPYFESPPNVNDSLGCFLVPSGMVYAIMFGFAFQEVFEKHTNIDDKLKGQTLSMRKLVLLIESMETISPRTFLHVLHTLKDEITNIIFRIQSMENLCVSVNIWGLLKPLNSDQRKRQSPVDQIVFVEVLHCLHDLNVMSAESGCVTEHMHIFQWIFLETLGYFSFLGVLLIQADSYRMELAMCIVTVVSITLLCCVVSDLDFPFHGFFLIDLQMLIDLIDFLHTKSKDVQTRVVARTGTDKDTNVG